MKTAAQLPSRIPWLAAMLLAALAAVGCSSSGLANPCDPAPRDVIDSVPVTSADPALGTGPIATLRWEQRFTVGIDGGCPTTAPVRLSLHGRTDVPIALRYRITWTGQDGGWFRDGVVPRLARGFDVDLGGTGDVDPLDAHPLSVAVTDVQSLVTMR